MQNLSPLTVSPDRRHLDLQSTSSDVSSAAPPPRLCPGVSSAADPPGEAAEGCRTDSEISVTPPVKLHAGVASAMSVWENTPLKCVHDLDGRPLCDVQTPVALSREFVRDDGTPVSPEGAAEGRGDKWVAEPVPWSDPDDAGSACKAGGKGDEGANVQVLVGGHANLQPGVTSAIAPPVVKEVVDQLHEDKGGKLGGTAPLDTADDAKENVPSAVQTQTDTMSMSAADSEYTGSLPEASERSPVPAQVISISAEVDAQLEMEQETAEVHLERHEATTMKRRKSCTAESGREVRTTTGDTDLLEEASMSTPPKAVKALNVASSKRPPRPYDGDCGLLVSDSRGGWSVSPRMASRSLEEEIQAGEADMPAWGRSPSGWAVQECEGNDSISSNFESPKLGSLSASVDSRRALDFDCSDEEEDGRSTSTLSLDTRDRFARDIEDYMRARKRQASAAECGEIIGPSQVTMEASEESELTPGGFGVVRKLSESAVVEKRVGKDTMEIEREVVEKRLGEMLEAVRESTQVCREIRREVGRGRWEWLRWALVVVGIGVWFGNWGGGGFRLALV